MSAAVHTSVLLQEVIDGLQPKAGGVYIDATCGLGGHTRALLEHSGPDGRVLGVDRDPEALREARTRLAEFGDRLTLVEGDFSALKEQAAQTGHLPADGVLADLGVSSLQLDRPERGFSFQRKGPLDMRMGPGVGPTAAELLASVDELELTRILAEYGEVDRPKQVARAILGARDAGKLVSTQDLAALLERTIRGRPTGIHPATRTFQALRIAVNRELAELEALLALLPELVRPGGRAAIISFHSLEDRLVKRAFEDPKPAQQPHRLPVEPERKFGPWRSLQKKPVVAEEAEVEANPRSRSAKLRIAERREAIG
ncbi:MAG: 16S rRNA (cytosine(1402)-N(4))-methyltransferase RsmH [Deltaproteobacteria bacterium]|jgi:16S rRNA (cytosine1402-N4)-methyltransferase|nr:16S rRNA (cytosine(1402)-N(4))-methyltransferase RsmH [Deltaproteobacteria bacterium]